MRSSLVPIYATFGVPEVWRYDVKRSRVHLYELRGSASTPAGTAGRMRRIEDFSAVETAVTTAIARAERDGLSPSLSPMFKTPTEAAAGSPLFLDMTEDARLLFDRDAFLANLLAAFRARLDRLGARRIWRGNAWLWDLKL